jgi:hypothetical protein
MRQYWRDFDALERWACTAPHATWWRDLLSDMGGTGVWHETYFLKGGMESVYLDMRPTGFTPFAPAVDARRSLFSARRRLRISGADDSPPQPVTEAQLYGDRPALTVDLDRATKIGQKIHTKANWRESPIAFRD